MKMSKKVREYKSGDFIFAKVKGYPAWPARVQRPNGKKYFVYFYGTGETANLPPNMIFDYAENKDKFLTKTVKRRDFNDGVKQIEHDFANNVPLEQVVGLALEPAEGENNTVNESANETADESMGDTTVADETIAEENTTQNDTGIEDSDETGALIIDEGKTPAQKGKKSTAKTPAKETPKMKEPKTPRSRQKKEDEDVKEDDKKEEEIVSRSGRKIRPKRYIDEQTEDNSTLPSPAPKKRRGGSPVIEKEKEKPEPVKEKTEKNIKHFNAVPQFELEDLKQPFTPEDGEKDNIIITYLPSGQYIGVKLFQSRPSSFKNDNARLQWDRQAAANALTLKTQLEKGQITPQSVQEQLVMDLNLTEEEKATLDKGRETEEKKSRVQFLKTEMKLIELDTKIKTCLCLEKADTELCLKLLDELTELDLKPLMLLKHPSCVETIKRMRAYVGNTPSWDLSTDDALVFSQRAKQIRDCADKLYRHMKGLFTTPEGLSFWEFFSERVSQFKKVTAKLTSDELLELVHEPLEMTVPTSHTMKSSIEASNEENQEDEAVNKKNTPAKSKKTNGTPSKAPVKRQSSRRLQEEKEKEVEQENEKETEEGKEKTPDKENDIEEKDKEVNDDKEKVSNDKDAEEEEKEKTPDKDSEEENMNDSKESNEEKEEATDKEDKSKEKSDSKESKDKKDSKDKNKSESKDKDKKDSKEKNESKDKKESKDTKGSKDKNDKDKKKEKEEEKEKNEDEPRAKRSRESKKTEPPPRSPSKRKSKVT